MVITPDFDSSPKLPATQVRILARPHSFFCIFTLCSDDYGFAYFSGFTDVGTPLLVLARIAGEEIGWRVGVGSVKSFFFCHHANWILGWNELQDLQRLFTQIESQSSTPARASLAMGYMRGGSSTFELLKHPFTKVVMNSIRTRAGKQSSAIYLRKRYLLVGY